LPTLQIDSHPAVPDPAFDRDAIASLQANRIDPKFLYATTRQAELWRQVSLRHSPISANPEFVRIYRDAYTRILEQTTSKKICLVGLGCGTGRKELDLHSALQARGIETLFTAIDISPDLVRESAQKLVAAGAAHHRSLVCDLAQTEFLAPWLDRLTGDLPRLITFFGLVPNLAPSAVLRLFRAVLRPGDLLLASVHLAPVAADHPDAIAPAMQTVLPQYDNPETLAWLAAALEHWGLENLLGPPALTIGEAEGIPAFLALAKWKTGDPFEKWGHRFSPPKDAPLRLFYSLRYTPALWENLLLRERLTAQPLALTSCRQEAIWSVKV